MMIWRQPGVSQRHPEGTQEAPRKHPGGSQEAPRRLPGGSKEAPRRLPEGTQEAARAPKAGEASQREHSNPSQLKCKDCIYSLLLQGGFKRAMILDAFLQA